MLRRIGSDEPRRVAPDVWLGRGLLADAGRLLDERRVVSGVVANGRLETRGGEEMVGLFLNTLPFPVELGEEAWDGFVKRVFDIEQSVVAYRRFPLSEIQRMAQDGVWFDSVFNYTDFHVYQGGDARAARINGARYFEHTNFPIVVHVHRDHFLGQMRLIVNYDGAKLDVSLLDELPPGRSPIVTKLLKTYQEKQAHNLIRAEVMKGRQAYVVFPLMLRNALPAGTPRLMPVGRLDLNTEGLLLLTTDGGLKRRLELPATGVERTYRARAFGSVSQERLEALIEGIEIAGVRYGPIDANLERRTGRNQWIELRLQEGKNREVRRVLEHLGLKVSRLIRTAYGPLALGDLRAGEVEEVRRHDLAAFLKGLRAGGATHSRSG